MKSSFCLIFSSIFVPLFYKNPKNYLLLDIFFDLINSNLSSMLYYASVCSSGYTVTIGRNNFGITLSLGFDMALGQNSTTWIYQNRPWLGIGVSTNLGLLK